MTACFDGAGPSEEKFVARIQLVTMAINNRVGMKPLVASSSRQAAAAPEHWWSAEKTFHWRAIHAMPIATFLDPK